MSLSRVCSDTIRATAVSSKRHTGLSPSRAVIPGARGAGGCSATGPRAPPWSAAAHTEDFAATLVSVFRVFRVFKLAHPTPLFYRADRQERKLRGLERACLEVDGPNREAVETPFRLAQ